jgi:hypothetical protein
LGRVGLAKVVVQREGVGEEGEEGEEGEGEGGGERRCWQRLRLRAAAAAAAHGDEGAGEEKSGGLGKRRQSSWAVVRSTAVMMRYSKRRTETPE